jgi:predicted translin family RNA/ssDNA-binding protein
LRRQRRSKQAIFSLHRNDRAEALKLLAKAESVRVRRA